MYLSASSKLISAALIREEDMVQKPVYYVNKSLVGAELNYLPLEKLMFTLVIAFRSSFSSCNFFSPSSWALVMKTLLSSNSMNFWQPVKEKLSQQGAYDQI